MGRHAQERYLVFQQLNRPSVGVTDDHDALLTMCEEQCRLGSHSRCEHHRRLSHLQRSQFCFKAPNRRVQPVAGVQVALAPSLNDVEHVGRRIETERRRVV